MRIKFQCKNVIVLKPLLINIYYIIAKENKKIEVTVFTVRSEYRRSVVFIGNYKTKMYNKDIGCRSVFSADI